MRRAPRWPRLLGASKSHAVLSSSQTQALQQVRGSRPGGRDHPLTQPVRHPKGQKPASSSGRLGAGKVRAWLQGWGVIGWMEAPANSSGMVAPNSAPQMDSPGYPKRAYCQRGETNFPFKVQGQQRNRWRVPACSPSTLPSPPLPFEPFLVLHTPPGRTVNGELVRGRLGVARSFSPPRPRASRLFHG